MKNTHDFLEQFKEHTGRRIWLTIEYTTIETIPNNEGKRIKQLQQKEYTLGCVLQNMYVKEDTKTQQNNPAFIYVLDGGIPVLVPFKYRSLDGDFVGSLGSPKKYEIKAIMEKELTGFKVEYVKDGDLQIYTTDMEKSDGGLKIIEEHARITQLGDRCRHNHLVIKGNDLTSLITGYTPLWKDRPIVTSQND